MNKHKQTHQAHRHTAAPTKQIMEEDVFQKLKRPPGSRGSGKDKDNHRVENDGAEEP